MSRASTRVRPAAPGDATALTALIRSAELTSGVVTEKGVLDCGEERLRGRLVELLGAENLLVLVAVDDGAELGQPLVGMLAAKRDEVGLIDTTPVLHVTHLLVAPRYRRRGVGRMLLTAAVHLADELGIDHVQSTAGSGSREANRYLSRLGFAPTVVHRIAPTSVLRRSLGMAEGPERMAALRRARLTRGRQLRAGLSTRVVGRGA